MTAIGAYSVYLPRAELSAASLAAVWGVPPAGLRTKRVAGADEDALSVALAAARGLPPDPPPASIGLASTSLPYRRRVQAGMLADALSLSGRGVFTSEHSTSSRAGTEALALHARLVDGSHSVALVVAAEVAGETLRGPEALGAAGVALTVRPRGSVATMLGAAHASGEYPGLEFARRGDVRTRDVGVPAYATRARTRLLGEAVGALLAGLDATPTDFDHVVLDAPDRRANTAVARHLGIDDERWVQNWSFPVAGDVAAAGALLGLCLALDAARPGERILLTAYGAGSAADAFALEAGPDAGGGVVARAVEGAEPVDYVTYLRRRGVI